MHFWSVAVYDLRLTPDQFWELTPRQFDALVKRQKVSLTSNEVLLGQIAAAIYNTGYRPKEPFPISDFMPTQWGDKAAKAQAGQAAVKMTRKSRKNVATNLHAMLNALISAKRN